MAGTKKYSKASLFGVFACLMLLFAASVISLFPARAAAANYSVQWNGGSQTAGPNAPPLTAAQISTALQSGGQWVNNQAITFKVAGTTINFVDSSPCPHDGSASCVFKPTNYGCPGTDMDIQIGPVANGKDEGHRWLQLSAVKAGSGNNKCQELLTSSGDNELPLNLANATAATAPSSTNNNPAPASTAAAATDSSSPSIDCGTFTNPINWFLCPVEKGLMGVVNGIDNELNSLMSVGTPSGSNSDSPSQIFDTSTASGKGYHAAWSSMRDIALGLMVAILLVILVAQATGSELVDTYTVKKSLPRFLAAAIGITLSWPLMQFFVTFTNDLGFGVRWLIYEPFHTLSQQSITLGGGGTVAVALATGGAIAALSIVGLLSFGLAALLAVLIAFLVIIIRQMLITLLIILAPVAIVLYILPNTKKAFDLWWDSFSKALLMFPIITGFIAAGRVFALVAMQQSSPINQLIGFAAYFAPYMLLPYAFRMAGGALATISGSIHGAHKGVFGGLKAYRGRKMKENFAAMKEGNRIQSSNFAAGAFNRTTRAAAHLPQAGMTPWKMRSRLRGALSSSTKAEVGEYMEKSNAFKAIMGNDDYLQATMKTMGGGDSEEAWRTYLHDQKGYKGDSLEQGVALIRAAKRDTSDEVFKLAATAANFSTGTGFKEGGIGQANAAINEAAGEDRDAAAWLTAEARGRAERAQRWDLAAPGFGAHLGSVNAMHNQFSKIDSQIAPTSDDKEVLKAAVNADKTLSDAQKAARINAIDSQTVLSAKDKNTLKENIMDKETGELLVKGIYSKAGGAGALIQSRGQAVEQVAPRIVERIKRAHNNVVKARKGGDQQAIAKSERELAQEYAYVANLHDSMNYASPEVARTLSDTVFDTQVAPGSPTIMENLDAFRRSQNPAYLQARKDYDARQYRDEEAVRSGKAPGGPMRPEQ